MSDIQMHGGGPIPESDAMGREIFWLDLGRPKDNCCDDCSCKND